MTLKEIEIGKTARVLSVGGSGSLRQHFLDMGLIQGAEVTVIKYAPMGDPIELKIHGYELTLRLEDAEKIQVEEISGRRREKREKREFRKRSIPDMGRAENFMKRRRRLRFRRMRFLPLPWWEIRTAERQRCLIS